MAVVHTRRPLRLRLVARLQCVYFRWLIRHAEKDLAQHKRELEHALSHIPKQIDVDNSQIAELTKKLTDAAYRV